MGCEVKIFDTAPPFDEKCDLMLIDADTVAYWDHDICPIIKISSKEGTTAENTLRWPESVENIRRLCGRMLSSQEDRSAEKNKESDTDIVHIVSGGCVVIGERRIALSKTEMTVLKLLCEEEGRTVSRETIMAAIGATEGNIGDVYICRLRKKLEESVGSRLIFTIRKKGYRTSLRLI